MTISLDGESAQIQNGIGQFTEATLEVLRQYEAWPDLDDLKTRMDSKFKDGTKRPFKISIRSPGAIDDMPSNPDQLDNARTDPDSQAFEILKKTCDAHIARNELEEILRSIDKFLNAAKVGAFDPAKKSLQLLQSDVHVFREGERNATLGSDAGAERRRLIVRVQQLLELIKSIVLNSKPKPEPPIKRKRSEDFFRDQVQNLLSGNRDLTSLLASRISSNKQVSDLESVVDHLFSDLLDTNDFPIRRFKRILQKLVDVKIEISKASCQTLTLLTEILTIASYPVEERLTIEVAMEEILDSGVGNTTQGGLSTSKIEDAKKLLVATRLKLLNTEFKELNVAQLFNKDMIDNREVRLLLRKIYVVSEPCLKEDDLTLIEYYAKACIDGLGYEEESGSYEDDLNDVLREKHVDGAVISLLISNEKTDAIKQLRERFPLLLVVELPSKSVGLYTAIFRDLKDIDNCLPHLSATNT